MKWYARDWRGDGALRMCSFAARGFWADLLSLMHDEGDPYGELRINGQQPSPPQLSRMLGGTPKEIERLTAELELAGVFSRTPDGAIFSRRMVRDKAKADEAKANGKLGGNPQIKPPINEGVNPLLKPHTQNPFPEPKTKEEIKTLISGGKKSGNGAPTIADPLERLARFQAKLAKHLGPPGWEIVCSAADRDDPRHDANLALCKQAAQQLGKGWPKLWGQSQ